MTRDYGNLEAQTDSKLWWTWHRLEITGSFESTGSVDSKLPENSLDAIFFQDYRQTNLQISLISRLAMTDHHHLWQEFISVLQFNSECAQCDWFPAFCCHSAIALLPTARPASACSLSSCFTATSRVCCGGWTATRQKRWKHEITSSFYVFGRWTATKEQKSN